MAKNENGIKDAVIGTFVGILVLALISGAMFYLLHRRKRNVLYNRKQKRTSLLNKSRQRQ